MMPLLVATGSGEAMAAGCLCRAALPTPTRLPGSAQLAEALPSRHCNRPVGCVEYQRCCLGPPPSPSLRIFLQAAEALVAQLGENEVYLHLR